MLSADPLTTILSIAVLGALVLVLVLSLVALRRPAMPVVAAAAVLAVCALLACIAAAPMRAPLAVGIPLALVATAAAVVGGNPFTRRALDIATGKRVRETEDGGIVIIRMPPDAAAETRTLMRGGTVIGYLERFAATLSILVGYPAAIAAIVAVKGVGRFPELAESEARERFIIGTLASLLWSGAIGAIARLMLG